MAQKALNWARGWFDFFLTVAENLLPTVGMTGLAMRVVERHYADPTFRPWARDLCVAQILERTGRTREAEEHYQRAIQPGLVDGHLFLGDFYRRQQQIESAIRTFEKALSLASDQPQLAKQLQERLGALRQGGSSTG